MTAFCALLPLASVFVSLSFGGATSPFVLVQTLVLLPLFASIRLNFKFCGLLAPIFILSIVMRFASLYMLSKGSLGIWGGICMVTLCIVISGVTAFKGDTVLRFATPLLFLALLLAVYVTAVSFSSPLRSPFDKPQTSELISAVICPFSACVSFSLFSNVLPLKCFKDSILGVLLCAVFIIFDAAGAEFGFLSVPLAVLVSSIEIKAIVKGISKRVAE